MFKLTDILNKQQLKQLKCVENETKSVIKIKENWEKIFGKLAQDLSFDMIKDKTLYINAKNPVWASEIDYYKDMLLNKINAEIKPKKMKDINIIFKKHIPPTKKNLKITTNKTLEEKIKDENKRKEKEGYKRCENCFVWIKPDQCCIFCH